MASPRPEVTFADLREDIQDFLYSYKHGARATLDSRQAGDALLPLVRKYAALHLREMAEQERPTEPIDPDSEAEQAYIEARNEVCAKLIDRADQLDSAGAR